MKQRVEVPFVDLSAVNASVRETVLEEIGDVIDSGAFSNGPQVEAFEHAFAEFAGARYCVGVASGLDALRLALIAAGVEPGDRVVVPASTFVATFEAVVQAGGIPLPVDVREDDWQLDPKDAEQAFADGTRFALPVHLYGQMCDMRALAAAAERHSVTMIEDACQAHGATRDGVRVGDLSVAAAFSFYPAKNLGAFGDAGALVTDSERIATCVRALRQHGEIEKYRSVMPGWTSRLDTLQAIVLIAKLPGLTAENGGRRRVAAWYDERLRSIPELRLPPLLPASDPVWHLYVVRTTQAKDLAEFLMSCGIETGRHYPEPPHLSEAYRTLGYGPGSFPVAERIAAECLSLPMFAGLLERQVDAVSDALHEFFGVG